MTDKLILVSSDAAEPIVAAPWWIRKVTGTILCRECGGVAVGWKSKPVDVTLLDCDRPGIGAPVSGVCVLHTGVAEQIAKDMTSRYVFGKCYDKGDALIEDYVTCYCTSRVILRAGPETKYRICQTCGSITFQRWRGGWYTLRRYLSNATVYQEWFGSILLDENLASELSFIQWPDAVLKSLSVLDMPIDGQHLPGDQ